MGYSHLEPICICLTLSFNRLLKFHTEQRKSNAWITLATVLIKSTFSWKYPSLNVLDAFWFHSCFQHVKIKCINLNKMLQKATASVLMNCKCHLCLTDFNSPIRICIIIGCWNNTDKSPAPLFCVFSLCIPTFCLDEKCGS